MEQIVCLGDRSGTQTEKKVWDALRSFQGKPSRSFEGRTIKKIEIVPLGNRNDFKISLWNPKGSCEKRLVTIRSLPKNDPPLPEVIYLDPSELEKLLGNRRKLRQRVSDAIEVSFLRSAFDDYET